MSTSIVQWIIVFGVVVICSILLIVVDQLRNLSHKIEYWNRMLSEGVDAIRAGLTEVTTHASSLQHDVADIASRAEEKFPTVDEIERARNDQP